MAQKTFTRKLVKVYTLIFAIPILILVIIAIGIFWNRQVKKLTNSAVEQVAISTDHVQTSFNSMVLAESIFTSNLNFLRTLYFTGENDLQNIIDDIKDFTDEIEHIKLVMPQIYAMRVFVKNENIPERWPVIFNENRLSTIPFNRWTYNFISDLMGNIESAKYPSVCLQSELNISRKHIGFIQITMQMQTVFPFLFEQTKLSNTNFVYKNGISIINQYSFQNQDYFSHNYEYYDNLSKEIWKKSQRYMTAAEKQGLQNGNCFIFNKGKFYVVAWNNISPQDLTIVHITSMSGTTLSILGFLIGCFAVIIFSIAVMFFVLRYTTNQMTDGLTQVMDAMDHVKKDNYDVVLNVKSDDEVGQMAETFNKMVAQIKEQIHKIEAEQKLLSETQIKAMQNQINAHFLYNALETIKMQAELADEEDIVQSITLLGKMMHYCLKWKNPKVTLAEEIEYINCYVDMLNIRNDYFVQLDINLPPEYENLPIMKMLLQPVIENAFYHGIEPRGTDSLIKLYTEPDYDKKLLNICIKDFGVGMNAETLKKLIEHINNPNETEGNTKKSIGLKNIQERLFVFFGSDYVMQIESVENEGTTIKIPIPLNL